MKFVISTDAAADLSLDYIKKNDVKVISMKYVLDGEEYTFGNGEKGLSAKEFADKMRGGATGSTMLINEENHIEHFEGLLKEGKDILHIPLSSGLSGTAEFAATAAKKLADKYPLQKIIVFDFKGASMGQGLFVDYLVNLRNEGKNIEEALKWAEENISKLCHYFTVDDLKYLRRGGRISGFSFFVGSMLKIKPLLHVNDEGKLIPLKKNIGRTKSLIGIVEKTTELIDEKAKRIFICQCDCIEDADFVASHIKSKLQINDIVINDMGPIIGLHSGPGTLAVFFLGKHR